MSCAEQRLVEFVGAGEIGVNTGSGSSLSPNCGLAPGNLPNVPKT